MREKWRSTETEEFLLHIALFPTCSKFIGIPMVFDARLARHFVIIVYVYMYIPSLVHIKYCTMYGMLAVFFLLTSCKL